MEEDGRKGAEKNRKEKKGYNVVDGITTVQQPVRNHVWKHKTAVCLSSIARWQHFPPW